MSLLQVEDRERVSSVSRESDNSRGRFVADRARESAKNLTSGNLGNVLRTNGENSHTSNVFRNDSAGSKLNNDRHGSLFDTYETNVSSSGMLKSDKQSSTSAMLTSNSNGNVLRTNETNSNRSGRLIVDKAREAGKRLTGGKQRNVLRTNEEAANARLLNNSVSTSKLSPSQRQKKHTHLSDDGKIVSFGNVNIENRKLAKTEKRIQKRIQGRYRRDMAIKGGIVSPLRVETSMQNKLRPTSLQSAMQDVSGKMHSSLQFVNKQLENGDDLGIQHAWTDIADRTVTSVSKVYKVSSQAKYFRAMRNEKNLAKLLRKEDKIVRNTFKVNYREAYKTFKNSPVGKNSSFLLKQKQKRYLKRIYMKNAIKQYQQAKKAGEAARVTYSTGLSIADKAKQLLTAVVKILVESKAWIVILIFAALLFLPTIFSAIMTMFIGLFGGAQNETQQGTGFPQEVLQWKEFVEERCEENNDPTSEVDLTLFVNAILTTIQQESGGKPETCEGDVMQCKACGLWDDSAMPSDWSEAQKSIDVGIRYFYQGLKTWNVTDPEDYDGLQIVAQGYNYSFEFLTWMKDIKKADKWTLELSTEYSNMKAQEMGWERYGDKSYGQEWLDKYMNGMTGSGSGAVDDTPGVTGVLNTAANQVGITENPSGSNNVIYNTDFYGREVHDGDGQYADGTATSYPWCCVFVWWCFNKSGNGEAFYNNNKTAGVATVAGWADSDNLWINKSEAQPGDLLLFKDGSSWSHIEIITSVEGNTIHTIGGNTTPEGNAGSDYNGGCVAIRNRTYANTTHYFVRPEWNQVEN